MPPTTAPTIRPVEGLLEVVLPPLLEPLVLLPPPEPPLPLPLEFPLPLPLPPVCLGPLEARLAGDDCSTELVMPAAVTWPAAALQ